jgi:hypothetical protein
VTEPEWATFLAEVVTPRFPDGLTVLDAYGQYRDDSAVRAERTRVLVLVHAGSSTNDAAIHAIVEEYERRFAQRSVLRVDTRVRADGG